MATNKNRARNPQSTAKSSRQGAPSVEPDIKAPVWDSLAIELIGACMAALKSYGFSAERLHKLAKDSADGPGEIPVASLLFQDVHRLGDLANEWNENPEYVDATGHPKVLPMEGPPPSFGALVEKYFGPRPVEEIAQLGMETRVLEEISGRRVAQCGACVMLTGNRFLQLVRAIHSVRWLLSTAEHNAQPITLTTWPDRQVCGFALEGDFPDFVKVMRQPMVNLVEMGNRWLTIRGGSVSEKPVPGGEQIMMGIHAYIFQDKSITKRD